MKINRLLSSFLCAGAVLAATAAGATDSGVTVLDLNAAKPGAEIQPTMYGLFFEDINYGADGGLYAEMVKNRSFEFPQNLMGWYSFGGVEVREGDGPFERNPHYVRLSAAGHDHKHTGIENEGFFGVSFKEGEQYRFSVWARTDRPGASAKIRIELVDPATGGESQVCAKKHIEITSDKWTKYTAVLKPTATVSKGKLRVFLAKPDDQCAVDLEHVSLFPVNTWNGHENGLRADLAQALYDLKPGVFRFPGGCIVEGTELGDRYQWKNTVGPVENRPLNMNRWHYTFPKRFFPDYYQTYGLGFYEYFLLSEEIGAEPLPVINVGLVCQYQNDDLHAHVPSDSLDCYIQDALDLIEFANGDTTTTWGALRAEMGHPAPFNLKFLGVGNEQWGPEYVERLAPFVKTLRAKHPEIKIIGSSGPDSEGDKFDYLWPEMKRLGVDLVDEHFYRKEDWFSKCGTRYDNYDRKGPKVFAGEYACHGRKKKYNHFNTALWEAALMTGLERNADVVHMATYAPLFAHTEGWQWRPDMIWFDNMDMTKTSSYNVQQLYSLNKGTNVLPLTLCGKPVAGLDDQNGLFASAVLDKNDNSYIIKIVNTAETPRDIRIDIKGLPKKATIGSIKVLSLDGTDALDALEGTNMQIHSDVTESTLAAPTVEKRTATLSLGEIPAKTFRVYRLPLR